jgi:hypothetical protein
MNARKTEIPKNCPDKLAGLVMAEVKKELRIGLNKLLLQIKATAFTTVAIPLTVYKTGGAVKIAIQDHF